MPSKYWTKPAKGTGLANCILCNNPTRSHAIRVIDDVESGSFSLATENDEADFLYPVCHKCYIDIDADPTAIIDRLESERSPMLDDAGLTPSTIASLANIDELAPNKRTKSFGDEAHAVLRELASGDVFELNDDRRWVAVPLDVDAYDDARGDVLFSVIEHPESGSPAVGAVVESAHPFNDDLYLGYVASDDQTELEYTDIESVELLGSTPVENKP